MAQKDYLGKVFPSKNYGFFKVISYNGSSCVTVEFQDTGYVTVTDTGTINKGVVKDKLIPTVFGVGVLGEDVAKEGLGATAYTVWRSMLQRCYSSKTHKRQPTYELCTVSDEFKFFPTFRKWFENQPYCDGFELDKDLLRKDNTVYSPNSCCLLPKEINCLLGSIAQYGCCTIICYLKRRQCYELVWNNSDKGITRTHHPTYREAFGKYKELKESQLKSLAEKWKDSLSEEAYKALITYSVYSE